MELINIVIQYSRGHGVNTLNSHIWYGNILSLVASRNIGRVNVSITGRSELWDTCEFFN